VLELGLLGGHDARDAHGIGGAGLGLDVGEQLEHLVAAERLLFEERGGDPFEGGRCFRRTRSASS